MAATKGRGMVKNIDRKGLGSVRRLPRQSLPMILLNERHKVSGSGKAKIAFPIPANAKES